MTRNNMSMEPTVKNALFVWVATTGLVLLFVWLLEAGM